MSGCNGASGGSSELAELLDGLAARLQAGEVVDVETHRAAIDDVIASSGTPLT